MQEVIPKSIQTRLTDLAKENRPLVLADTFARERESGDSPFLISVTSRRAARKSHPILLFRV